MCQQRGSRDTGGIELTRTGLLCGARMKPTDKIESVIVDLVDRGEALMPQRLFAEAIQAPRAAIVEKLRVRLEECAPSFFVTGLQSLDGRLAVGFVSLLVNRVLMLYRKRSTAPLDTRSYVATWRRYFKRCAAGAGISTVTCAMPRSGFAGELRYCVLRFLSHSTKPISARHLRRE